MRVNERLARAARRIVRDYRLNWIYASPVRAEPIALPSGLEVRPLTQTDLDHAARSTDAQVRKAVGYPGLGAQGFVLVGESEELLGIAHYCDGACYPHGSTWPLGADQLALVDIVMLPAARGQGYAALLIAHATRQALAQGGQAGAICFIWWNHHASLRAFRRAGWRAMGFSVELIGRGGRVRALRAGWSGVGRETAARVSPDGGPFLNC